MIKSDIAEHEQQSQRLPLKGFILLGKVKVMNFQDNEVVRAARAMKSVRVLR